MPDARVMVIDDSPLVRQILGRELARRDGVTVVGTAGDGESALEQLARVDPDVLTLDIEMPRMDGLAFLERLRRLSPDRRRPVVVVSGHTRRGRQLAVRCLEAGAIDVLTKPEGKGDLPAFCDRLAEILRAAAGAERGGPAAPAARPDPAAAIARARPTSNTAGGPVPLLLIGASTGGTEAIARALAPATPASPPIAIVQHMPPDFTRTFAERLDQRCAISVREAADGDALAPGTALIAPGDRHLVIERSDGFRVRVTDDAHVRRHRPSVEVLYDSAGAALGGTDAQSAAAVLLTGMGDDGADALGRLQRLGVRTICQDEATSVVWGMPGVAVRKGFANEVLPIDRIAAEIGSMSAAALRRSA